MRTRPTPYLSIVVTSRNDDHGGDPLKRLQAFINCFEAQCRLTGLDAEVIVVEWNPPEDKPGLQTLVKWPARCVCTYRLVSVPPALHATLKYSDVLPLFQMIAKNVGIRRARGRFVLVTNIDILFARELVEYLASGQLEPGHLYRVDRHDIQAAVPVDAPLDELMAYCERHHLRIHAAWGSCAVDGLGRPLPAAEDIVDGKIVRLGAGWHVREGTSAAGFWRWAMDRAYITVDRSGDPSLASAVLEIEMQSNPYTPSSWVDLAIVDEKGTVLARHRVTRRKTWRLPLEGHASRTFELRCVGTFPENRRGLAVFERRASMHYQVRSITVRSDDGAQGRASQVYPAAHWRAVTGAAVECDASQAVRVTTNSLQRGYAVEYGPMTAPRTDRYRFELTYDVAEGDIHVGVLDQTRASHPTVVDDVLTPRGRVTTLDVQLAAGTDFSLIFSNDHPEGDCVSRFCIRQLAGSVDPDALLTVEDHEGADEDRDEAPLTPDAQESSVLPSSVATARESWADRRRRLKAGLVQEALVFSLDGWRPANQSDAPELKRVDDGLSVVSRGAHWSYCIEHGPFRAPVAGTYRFAIDYRLAEGGIVAGLLDEQKRRWLPSASRERARGDNRTLTVSVRLRARQTCWLTLSNDHQTGGVSRFVMTGLRGSVAPYDWFSSLLNLMGKSALYWRGQEVQDVSDGHEDEAAVWAIADPHNATRVECAADGLLVETDPRDASYVLLAGPMRAPVRGLYSFSLACDVAEGGIRLGIVDRHKTRSLTFWSDGPAVRGRTALTTSARLRSGQLFWLIVSNALPHASGPSRFVVRTLRATVKRPRRFAPLRTFRRWRDQPAGWSERLVGQVHSHFRKLPRRVVRLSGRFVVGIGRRLRSLPQSFAPRVAGAIARRAQPFIDRVRANIVHRSPEYAESLAVRQALEKELARISEFGELAHLHKLLQEHRPDALHLNGCGDFQLMAREHWMELRGYPEFQTFSMNIDALFSSIAHYAGIRERILASPCHIYHLEHEKGSGWTPEGEALLRQRIAERGIKWLDPRDVFAWSAYMHWLGQPMIFNASDWGFGAIELEESVIESAEDRVTSEVDTSSRP